MNKRTSIGNIIAILLILNINHNVFAQAWQQLNDTPFYTHHTNGFGFDGKAYVIQGDFEENESNKFWEYTPATDSWSLIGDFPGPAREIAIGDDWNGKYYFGFGWGSGGDLSDLWEFDPVSGSFTELPTCPCVGRSHPALIAHNDKIFMGSGSGPNGDLDDWWEYDMLTQEWTQKEDIPGGDRHHPFFFGMDNKVYVGGGHRNNWIEYNMDTEVWTEIDNLPGGRVAGTQLNYNGLGLIVGGDDASHSHVPDLETFMSYDPQTEDWTYLPSLPFGSKWAPSSFIIDESLYFFGGISNDVDDDDALWKFDLTILDCLPAKNLNAVMITDNSADLFWQANLGAETDTLKWRKVGEAWNIIINPQAIFSLTDLEACEEYEFEITTTCESLNSNSGIYKFKTDGCCTNPTISMDAITSSSASLVWPSILAAEEYEFRWRAIGLSNWSEVSTTNTSYELTDLEECTEYELQVKTICDIEDIEYSESMEFITKGCGPCTDNEYCSIAEDLDGDFYFINKVQINDYVNETGSDNGYGNFENPDLNELMIGEPFQLSIEPGYSDFSGLYTITTWIDFNGDNNFTNNEMVYNEEFIQEEINTSVSIPNDAIIGLTRMRIMLTDNFDGNSPCNINNYTFGEVEDYCITFSDGSTSNTEGIDNLSNQISIYPNPFTKELNIQLDELADDLNIELYDLLGNKIQENQLSLDASENVMSFNTQNLSKGIYFLKASNNHGEIIYQRKLICMNDF